MKEIIVFILLLFNIAYSYSQECGGGISKIQFYVLNDNNTSISYQILDLDQSNINKIISKKESEEIYNENQIYNNENQMYYDGIILNEVEINNLDLITKRVKKLPFQTDLKGCGKIKNGEIEFKTAELYDKPCLIKISTDKYRFYILINLFGGCSRNSKIILGEQPSLMR